MNIQEIVSILVNAGIEQNEAVQEVKLLIEHYCDYGVKDIIMGRPLDYEKLKVVREKAELRAKTRLPIQYIIGKAYFMGDYYKVTPDVLIPRDETEIVVKHALDIIKQYGLKSVLEIGSGSGCIACSVAKYGKVDVTSVDISEKALKVASDNASELGVKVKFLQSDLFGALDKNTDKFDIIISNPPYIPAGTELQKEVTFEPEIALFTSESTGCEFYKKIVEQGANYLNHNGYIVFELGVNESEIVRKYFLDNSYTDISVQKDLAGIDRVIRGKCIISSPKF